LPVFSLSSLIAPLLGHEGRPAESRGLVSREPHSHTKMFASGFGCPASENGCCGRSRGSVLCRGLRQ
jgi:hypothetical protein